MPIAPARGGMQMKFSVQALACVGFARNNLKVEL
jgi:hypothetical protein